MGPWWMTGLCAIWALAVAIYDVRQRRVPNALLTLLAIPAVLTLVVNHRGLLGAGIGDSLAGLVVGSAPLLAGYFIRQVGAGDVKLSGLQGLVLGMGDSLKALLISGIVLGVMTAFALFDLQRREQARPLRIPAAVALVIGFIAVQLAAQLVDYLPSGWGI